MRKKNFNIDSLIFTNEIFNSETDISSVAHFCLFFVIDVKHCHIRPKIYKICLNFLHRSTVDIRVTTFENCAYCMSP